jgi:hypothetical protein
MALSAQVGAALPAPPEFVSQVEQGLIDPEHFDFAPYWRLSPDERLRWQRDTSALLDDGDLRIFGCDPVGSRRAYALTWTSSLFAAPDELAWTARLEALRARLAKLDARIVAAAAHEDFAGLEGRVLELQQRHARSAFVSRTVRALKDAEVNGQAGNPGDKYWWILVSWRGIPIDCDNARWLRGQMEEIGWFDIPRFGAAADESAWRLVRAANGDPEFVRFAYRRLESLPAGHTSPEHLGFIWDSEAVDRGQKTSFGSIGECMPDGTWKPLRVRAPWNLDKRRAAKGMKPIAELALAMAFTQCELHLPP